MASKTDVENARREVRGVYARKIMELEAERNALRAALVSVLPFVCAGSADHEVKAALDVLYPSRPRIPDVPMARGPMLPKAETTDEAIARFARYATLPPA